LRWVLTGPATIDSHVAQEEDVAMTVTRDSLPDIATQSTPPAPRMVFRMPWRQSRETTSDQEAAGAPPVAASIAATTPSWPRIFPGL
jgi:hypothetical protein